MSRRDRADALAEVAERVALLNEFRTDDFQDRVVRMVHEAREHWREEGELPQRGHDPLYDALVAIADVADSSPVAVRDACAEALDESGAAATAGR